MKENDEVAQSGQVNQTFDRIEYTGIEVSQVIERRARDRKVAGSIPGKGGRRGFLYKVNFLRLLLFSVRSTPVLPQCHEQDPGKSP